MIRVTMEFSTLAEMVSFFASSESGRPVNADRKPSAQQEGNAPKLPASTPADAVSTRPSADTSPPAAPAEVTPEMGSALIIKMIPTPEHKAKAAEILAAHNVKGFKHLTTPAARAACYADLRAAAEGFGIEV